MQTNVTSTHSTILLLSRWIISAISTSSDGDYSQLNSNCKNAWDVQLLSRKRTNPVIRCDDLIIFCPRVKLCGWLMFYFQRTIKKIHSSLPKLCAEDGKYQSHGTYKVASLFIALDSILGITWLHTPCRDFPYIISSFRTYYINMTCFCKHQRKTWPMVQWEMHNNTENKGDCPHYFQQGVQNLIFKTVFKDWLLHVTAVPWAIVAFQSFWVTLEAQSHT